MITSDILKRIESLLLSGETVELHLERGRLVIVKVSRKAEKTELSLKTE